MKKHGFTLIEILIGLALMTLVFATVTVLITRSAQAGRQSSVQAAANTSVTKLGEQLGRDLSSGQVILQAAGQRRLDLLRLGERTPLTLAEGASRKNTSRLTVKGNPLAALSGKPVVVVSSTGDYLLTRTSVQESAATGATQALIIAPGPIEVRSLTPTGSAYSGTLSIMSRQGLTVSSSLIASSPVCTTYPVRNAAGSTEPATCNGESSNDGLGLISERGDIHIGEPTQSLVSGDTSLTLQASLLAPRGNIAIQDSRLETVDWIGSAASDSFTPTRRLRLAYDPRALALPGFPEMPGSLTPVRVSFETERDLD